MADAGLFIGWGAPIQGREAKGLEVFNETIAYYGGLQGEGKIESFEVALLEPHGGELGGFIMVRGSSEQMSALRVDEEFERMLTRATLVVEGVGCVGASINDGLARAVGIYQGAIGELV